MLTRVMTRLMLEISAEITSPSAFELIQCLRNLVLLMYGLIG